MKSFEYWLKYVINESIDMSKYNIGDMLSNGITVKSKTISIFNGNVVLDTLKPNEAYILEKELKSNGFNVEYIKTGSYYDKVIVNGILPTEQRKFAIIVEDTLKIILLNTEENRIRNTNKF